ncbi:ExbD/TolR family protein [Natronogracilivirga saccharolytica]|uniref:Biopolymer transporter ExbD n=1 Tax=Natronogracilivirga saccharolytica TaxID=2812953 RepID=A0A8J7RM40_9BACT|nr:biopolymer transporter ExbD [Natronogracilivirga saccharolytica]MBP3192229.1 biopolymer transporter ExbD [Natronogracilivirga saccharolytica]
MQLKKRSREEAEVPQAGMADIAFLLLIFFLVVTTIDVDTGIGMQLPPPPDPDEEPPPIRERNLMNILVNARGQILINEEQASLHEVQQLVMDFVDNQNRAQDPELAEDPRSAIVSIKTDRQTPYEIYIDMLDEVIGAYRQLRDEAAQREFGVSYRDYSNRVEREDNVIREMYPQNISLAEPDPGS